jgi:hypothetical protein
MNGLTNNITQRPWLDAITAWYVWVEDAYRAVIQSQPALTRRSGPAPKFTDSEVITVGLMIETFFHGQEEIGYAFVAQYLRTAFPQLLDLDRVMMQRWLPTPTRLARRPFAGGPAALSPVRRASQTVFHP